MVFFFQMAAAAAAVVVYDEVRDSSWFAKHRIWDSTQSEVYQGVLSLPNGICFFGQSFNILFDQVSDLVFATNFEANQSYNSHCP